MHRFPRYSPRYSPRCFSTRFPRCFPRSAAFGVTLGLLGLLLLNLGGAGAAIANFSFLGTVTGLPGLEGAYAVTLSPDGAHVYATGGANGALVALSRNATTGQLTHVQTLQDGVDGVDGLSNA